MASKNIEVPRIGACVCISGLAKAAQYNDTIGFVKSQLMSGRLNVELKDVYDEDGTTAIILRLKPENLILACSHCNKTATEAGKSKLLKCAKCLTIYYCSKECQKASWKTHKATECKQLREKREERLSWEGKSHPTWKNLSKHHIRLLKELHAKYNCIEPWPVYCECSRMIESPVAPSFLVKHPNMIFKVNMSSVSTRRRGPQSFHLPILTEDTTLAGKLVGKTLPSGKYWFDMAEYQTHVPSHFPPLMQFAVIGECVFTKRCQMDLSRHFNTSKGKFFDWPEAKASISLCPGTGQTVKPDNHTRHILVAGVIAGMHVTGSNPGFVTRILPRILTLEGYDIMMGPSDNPRRFITSGTSRDNMTRTVFYPDVMKPIQSSTLNVTHNPRKVITASMCWERWTENGFEDAYDSKLKAELYSM